jgi:hypothetical protein
MYWKSFPTAIALTFSLLIAAAISSAYTRPPTSVSFILGCVAIALYAWAVFLHHKAFIRLGVKHAILSTLFWLALLMIVIPNLVMMLLLYGGNLAFILAPLGIILLPMIAVYYLLPYWMFGDELFLDETVIAPEGMAGIMASMLVWAVVIIVAFALMSLLAGALGRFRQVST